MQCEIAASSHLCTPDVPIRFVIKQRYTRAVAEPAQSCHLQQWHEKQRFGINRQRCNHAMAARRMLEPVYSRFRWVRRAHRESRSHYLFAALEGASRVHDVQLSTFGTGVKHHRLRGAGTIQRTGKGNIRTCDSKSESNASLSGNRFEATSPGRRRGKSALPISCRCPSRGGTCHQH